MKQCLRSGPPLPLISEPESSPSDSGARCARASAGDSRISTINVWAEDFHFRFGLGEFAEAELAVEAVGVASRQTETTQPLQSWMAHHAFHQPFSQTFAAMMFEDVDIAEIGKGGGVGDDSREADLIFGAE